MDHAFENEVFVTQWPCFSVTFFGESCIACNDVFFFGMQSLLQQHFRIMTGRIQLREHRQTSSPRAVESDWRIIDGDKVEQCIDKELSIACAGSEVIRWRHLRTIRS